MESKRHPDALPAILLTGGDPSGISPEIIPAAIELWLRQADKRPLVYFSTAPSPHLRRLEKTLSEHRIPIRMLSDKGVTEYLAGTQARIELSQKGLILFDIPRIFRKEARATFPEADTESRPGHPTVVSGYLALRALTEACAWIEKASCQGLVTAPLAKGYVDAACQSLGFPGFQGHTGFLADRFSSRVVMLMHGKSFSVLPLTTHIPLREVPLRLKESLEDGALIGLLQGLSGLPAFQGRRMALCALNPHAGESGLMGTEELDFLKDWVDELNSKGIPMEGPLAADGLFIESVRRNYRLILSCYHDQGLIPFKAIEGSNGVNVTMGLPFLRSSPDHGTAFGIAGQGTADATSMRRAMEMVLGEELHG